MTGLTTDEPRLIALTGPLQGKSFELAGEAVSVGRHRDCSVSLPDLAVSRRHCRLVPVAAQDGKAGGWRLEDLESRDGTFVNGRAIEATDLVEGDLILIGSSTFLFSSAPTEATRAKPAFEGLTEAETATRFAIDDSVYLQSPSRDGGFAAEGRMARALGGLLNLARQLVATETLEQLGSVLLRETLAVVPAQTAALMVAQADGSLETLASRRSHQHQLTSESSVRPEASSGPTSTSEPSTRSTLDPSPAFVAAVVAEGKALSWTRSPADGDAEPFNESDVRAKVAAPLIVRGEALGVLYVDSAEVPSKLTDETTHLLAAVAGLAAGALDGALRQRSLERENRRLREAELGHGLVGESAGMRKAYELLGRAAPSDSTVLLLGESGTGKELAARALHAQSRRAGRPFVAINCATLSETLLESELFGHERGAFTGAVTRKDGKLELAQGGTLFLDEVGELPLGLQARLLRVLQERIFERVGGTRSIAIDIRLIAATNRDLAEAVKEGGFRDDLYYRLNVICVELPPLREREGDVELLAGHFADLHGRTLHAKPLTITAKARAALAAHAWPGNVRELSNAIERAAVLGDGETIRPEDLPESVLETAPDNATTTFHDALNATKRRLITEALRGTSGNVTRAAEALDLHPNHLHRLMTNLGLRE